MNKLITLLLLLSCFAVSAQKKKKPVFVVGRITTADDSLRVKEYFYEALKEKTKRNLEESSKYFAQILEIDPANSAALYELASYHHSLNQDKEAEKYAREAVTVDSDNKWYWLLLADIYKDTKDLEQLAIVFDELIRINPENEDYYYDKANALFLLGKDELAESVYLNIEKRFGLSDELVSARQRIYSKEGNSDKAISELEGLISANPKEIKYYMGLSEIYLKAGDYQKTIDLLKKAALIDSYDPYIKLAMADAYKAQGKNKEAFIELKNAFRDASLSIDNKVRIILSFLPEFADARIREEVIELGSIVAQVHPANPKAHSVYGDVLNQDNQLQKAEYAYKKALALNNQVYQIWEQILVIQLNLKKFEELTKDGEEALTFFPNQAPLYFYTAVAYSQLHKHEKAIAYLKNATTLEVEDKGFLSQIYSAMGDAYNAIKDFKESDKAYDKALELNPKNTYVLNNFAYYLALRNENLDKAEAMSKLSNSITAGNASFEDTYAWVLFKKKNYKEARMWIEKAIKNNSNNGTQLEHYGDILFHLGDKDKALEQWRLAKQKGERSAILEKKIYEKKYTE